ncbi:Fe-S oxidoreductase [Krasilnikovia cinnamomea]|uniref:Fe-S oxidoreductase n=1 Tax=Krasilnikovia cinnamomea TaxID=349313 RepID=A0A4Q7ZKU0_9ACTN|nr:(Fe-S)-binding protein [Krasilnikovia cinnamomea]RZU50953.1 Fe-S oxidoreductase [Krasilnikovia cinnamomea]
MHAVQIVATVLAAAITVVAVSLAVRAVLKMTAVIRLGQPDPGRFEGKGTRTVTMLKETAGHTRMLKWGVVGAAHWFVMVAFIVLSLLVVEAYFEVVDPDLGLPLVGDLTVFGLVTEIIGVLGVIGIAVLIAIRLRNRPGRGRGLSRFTGSTMWQGYFVEWIIVAVLVCGFLIRGFKAATGHLEFPVWAAPVSHAIGGVLPDWEAGATIVALIKICISMTWLIVVSLNVTMGVAWHRFLAFFNIFFKRSPDKPAGSGLGALKPMTSAGKPLDFEEADPEKDQFGVAHVEQFTWKGLLDFSTCTECGRCQSQCPAWNTGKPLSPKLLVLSLRDHAYAKAPYLLAGGGKDLTGEEKATEDQLKGVDVLAMAESERPLIGGVDEQGVIDPDVLWSCTTCGACVEQCPVDIEHVDHIVDMRRYQVLIESSFPAEAGVMLRNLENKGNPWGAPQNTREDWTKGLDFEVPRVGEVEDFEYLFWVGCAGAFEDRAKKTTRAVATLLHEAGVNYAILGEGETCSGDPARRIGNEFVFQMLAQQNVETLNEAFGDRPTKKIVATCPHCFNTLGNEYEQVGGKFEVVHHTQLLAHLVAEGKLTPVQPVDGGVTYHDPCYLGRHNRVFEAPREVLGTAIEGGLKEMPRNSERSFCCGAGGARMYMEEKIGKRINVERSEEALATGAKTIAVGCPFCYTMISDGVTGKGEQDNVEVVDVASVLLRSIKGDASSA